MVVFPWIYHVCVQASLVRLETRTQRWFSAASHAAAQAFLCVFTHWLHYLCSLFSLFTRSGIYLFLSSSFWFHFCSFFPALSFYLSSLLSAPPIVPPSLSCLIYLAALTPELLQGTLTLTVFFWFHSISVQARELQAIFSFQFQTHLCSFTFRVPE